jgi:drug/metabolite transporter (DMT)-like permease
VDGLLDEREDRLVSSRSIAVHPPARPAFLALPAGAGPLVALVLASLLWGTADVAGKLALVAIPPATLAALRFGVALAIFWPLARWRGGIRAPIRITAPLGLLGVALTFLLQILGLDRTSATNASLLQGAAPVLTLVLAGVVLGERLGVRSIAAVMAAMAGVAVVTLSSGSGLRAPGLGDALVLASTGCFAAFVVLGRCAFPVYGTLPVLAGMAARATAALLPVAAVESWLTRPAAIGMGEVALVIYLGAGCSALTYALWGYALRHLEAGRAGTFDTLIPIVGIVAAVLVLQESPLVWHLVGGALVVTGVWLAVCEPRPIALPDGLRRAPAPRLEYPDGARVSASEALSG